MNLNVMKFANDYECECDIDCMIDESNTSAFKIKKNYIFVNLEKEKSKELLKNILIVLLLNK